MALARYTDTRLTKRENAMDYEARRAISYVLRLWRVTDEGGAFWRALLEDPRSNGRRGFASPEALFTYLREEIATQERNEQATDGTDGATPQRAGHGLQAGTRPKSEGGNV